jgi:hypothetical protein
MTLVPKLGAHPCRKSLLEVVNKEMVHLVGVAACSTVGRGFRSAGGKGIADLD